ncbi:hypothetical protein BS17DRAFT_786121 [Gyrodon lividus]|nr:hypothetical protein BS17DRAFT_786121 [Gyrodon lividus]
MDSPSEVSDVFSLSDHLLAERLQFVKEIGFGNWGSVWLCRPKSSSGKIKDLEVAVKLVHRSKTSTTAARVRSLWNEMKVVRSFKHDPHPSIVPFHSFIITPSYALITMAYLPTLVPVEVSEQRAKEWLRSLLSGVHFLHSRGVVHNDIKPANILLSRANVPVLVDFGFAEKYDLNSPKAFHSNLTYGTPEYLSPERARGLPHDTRKSDIWSLGVTFFEILIGRTPFEYEEGEIFEKKEDLERYWNRTMRGKWVGTYSMSQPAERFLKRMIVPNADLRCTAAEAMTDAYWDTTPPTAAHGQRQSASTAVPPTSHSRTPSFFDSLRDSFKDKEREKEPTMSRLLDVSLPWSASRSASRSSASASKSTSRTESTSRPPSRMEPPSKSASRTELAPRAASRTASASGFQTPETFCEEKATTSQASPAAYTKTSSISLSAHTRTHSRAKSQPKLRTPSGISTPVRARKLSTVQASPVVKPFHRLDPEVENVQRRNADAYKVEDKENDTNAQTARTHTLISLNSLSSMRRPHGPRQLSPCATPTAGTQANTNESLVSSGQAETKGFKHPLSHLTHLQGQPYDGNYTRARAHPHPLATRNVVQTPTHPHPTMAPETPFRTAQTSQQTSTSKQLSGRPPRARGRVGVLTDLTGFARNVDLSVHGVGRPATRGGENRDNVKENAMMARVTSRKENKENGGLPCPVQVARKETRVPLGNSEIAAQSTNTKEQDTSTASFSLVANLSGATTVTRGSVRDRMMDWERERERLREMDRLADMSIDGGGDRGSTVLTGSSTDSDSENDSDSEVEAEVVAEATSAEAARRINALEVEVNVELVRPTTSHTTTTVTTSCASTNVEKGQIEVAKIGVRASAQILSSRNGSVSVLGFDQGIERRPSDEGQVNNDSVTDIGLPAEVRRTSESGLNSLKHSVKASIDKGVRLYKSSTLRQLTGRNTPVWCASPEPIDFEERRSGEEGRFSWEDIRPEHEVALDRMNLWIQSVEKVVEETRQNFASTGVTPPAPLPLAPTSRSSSQQQQHATPNNTIISQININNTTYNTTRSSRLPRRLLAANEIFAESADPGAPLSPGRSRSEDQSTSFLYIDTSESSVPVLPSISVLMQTPPRKRRATISTRSPSQLKSVTTHDGIFESGSPSKRREKSKSQSNLDRHIRDVAKLEMELNRAPISAPSPRLSTVLDRSLFVAPPVSPRFTEDVTATPGITRGRSIQFDDLNSSPYHVEPYPPRKSADQVVHDSPDRQRLEGVYDRFLMATSGVKRVGKGYQSDNFKPVHNTINTVEHAKPNHSRSFGVFGTGKRAMPPPISSDDQWRRSTSIDELGFVASGPGTNASSSRAFKDESKATFVRRAIKAMVPGKTVSRRLSRTLVV